MGDEDEERRRIGVATYYVKSEREANEAHALARLAGYQRFAHLVFEAVDAKLAELRARFGPLPGGSPEG
jgi:hypothetical protein